MIRRENGKPGICREKYAEKIRIQDPDFIRAAYHA